MGSTFSKPTSSINSAAKQGPTSRTPPSDVEGRLIYILVEKGSVTWNAWEIKPPQYICDWVDQYLPEFFRHWALRVGDDVWELGAQGDRAYVSEDLSWRSISQDRQFDEYFVGATYMTKTQIDREGECRTILQKHSSSMLMKGSKASQLCPNGSHYDLINRNCQTFVQSLSESIVRTPLTANMTGPATTSWTATFGSDMNRFLRNLGWIPQQASDHVPESVKQWIGRMQRFILRCLMGNALGLLNEILPYLVDISWPMLEGIFEMLRQAGSHAIGGASMLLEKFIAAGPSLLTLVMDPRIVGIVFGSLALWAVWEGSELVWCWFRSKGNGLASQIQPMELQT